MFWAGNAPYENKLFQKLAITIPTLYLCSWFFPYPLKREVCNAIPLSHPLSHDLSNLSHIFTKLNFPSQRRHLSQIHKSLRSRQTTRAAVQCSAFACYFFFIRLLRHLSSPDSLFMGNFRRKCSQPATHSWGYTTIRIQDVRHGKNDATSRATPPQLQHLSGIPKLPVEFIRLRRTH